MVLTSFMYQWCKLGFSILSRAWYTVLKNKRVKPCVMVKRPRWPAVWVQEQQHGHVYPTHNFIKDQYQTLALWLIWGYSENKLNTHPKNEQISQPSAHVDPQELEDPMRLSVVHIFEVFGAKLKAHFSQFSTWQNVKTVISLFNI